MATGAVQALHTMSPKQRSEARNRVYGYVSKFAGSYWREAQSKPWLLNLILSIEMELEVKHNNQSEALATLQLEHSMLQHKYRQDIDAAEARDKELRTRVKQLEAELNAAAQARVDVENQLKQTQDALHAAEEAATHATDMCAQLNEAILVLNASDTARRKQLATRAYNLKEALLVSNSRLRQKADDVRKGKLETAAMLKMKEAWMQAEVIAAEANAKADYAVFESEAARFKLAYERMRKPFRMGGMAYQVVRTDIAA